MSAQLEQVILTMELRVPLGKLALFFDWQSKYHQKIVAFSGFISLEMSSLHSSSDSYEMIQRFSNDETLKAWVQSPERQKMLEELHVLLEANEGSYKEDISHLPQQQNGVTEVIVVQVERGYEEGFRQWIAKIHSVESGFPGFQKVYVQSPSCAGDESWVTLIQFDTVQNLDLWLASDERKKILGEAKQFIKRIESHRIVSSFAGWFGSDRGLMEVPPVWKQTMLVLLVLFPIVMLERQFLLPVLSGLNSSVATFISNLVSITLISWPMMPIMIRYLKWWLNPKEKNRRKSTVLGFFLILFFYFVEIIIFL